jgi:hypothetical protein
MSSDTESLLIPMKQKELTFAVKARIRRVRVSEVIELAASKSLEGFD